MNNGHRAEDGSVPVLAKESIIMSVWDKSAGLITRAGDQYETTHNNVVYYFNGITDQEETPVTDGYGAIKIQSKTIVTIKTSDAANIGRQQVITRSSTGQNWIVDLKQLLGDGNLTKLTLKEQ
jgi:hypothetical protein